jgi:hypothetical protein
VASCAIHAGTVILEEIALVCSSVALGGANLDLWESLQQQRASHRLPFFDPASHMGPLAALRDLGIDGCQKVLDLHAGTATQLPSPREVSRQASILRHMANKSIVPHSSLAIADGDYFRLNQAISLNSFSFQGSLRKGDSGYDVGAALFLKASRINHSCRPNADFNIRWLEDRGVLIRITANRDVQCGEEICISYLPAGLRAGERRRRLRENWNFDCNCDACVAEAGRCRRQLQQCNFRGRIDTE